MATQESIQKVRYSLGMRSNPMNENDPKKAYANVQLNGIVSLPQLAKHIKDHGSPYGRDVVLGVLTAIVDCTREFLTQGYKVDLGDLGSFEPSIKQKGAKSFEEFSSDNITDYRAIYSMSTYFDDMRSDVQFQRVLTRKDERAKMTEVYGGDGSTDGGSDGGSTDGGGDGQNDGN